MQENTVVTFWLVLFTPELTGSWERMISVIRFYLQNLFTLEGPNLRFWINKELPGVILYSHDYCLWCFNLSLKDQSIRVSILFAGFGFWDLNLLRLAFEYCLFTSMISVNYRYLHENRIFYLIQLLREVVGQKLYWFFGK